MKKLLFISVLFFLTTILKSQTYTSDRTVTWQKGKVVDEKFNKVEIDIDEEKKLIYISWLDFNYQWAFDIIGKVEDNEVVVFNCKGANGAKVTIGYYKPDNEFLLMRDVKDGFVFQHIKKKK